MSDAVVIGAGPAGLAAAAMLARARIDTVVLEQDRIGASWRHRYLRLRLNSTRLFSSLPGYVIERSNGRWVSRDDLVAYLTRYAAFHDLDVRCGVRVERIDREVGEWRVTTDAGSLRARAVVVATGYDRTPRQPDWPGVDTFTGRLLHAADYREPGSFRGQDVLVVGSGNSGFEIALDLAEGGARSVHLSVRTPPLILAHEWLGIPATWFSLVGRALPAPLRDRAAALLQRGMFGDLARFGLPAPRSATTARIGEGRLPTIDKGTVAAIKAGAIAVVAAVERSHEREVTLADGTRLEPDCIVAATAYRRDLEPLVGHLDVLRADGRPRRERPGPDHHGLYFNGYTVPLTGHLSTHLFGARRLARRVADDLRDRGPDAEA